MLSRDIPALVGDAATCHWFLTGFDRVPEARCNDRSDADFSLFLRLGLNATVTHVVRDTSVQSPAPNIDCYELKLTNTTAGTGCIDSKTGVLMLLESDQYSEGAKIEAVSVKDVSGSIEPSGPLQGVTSGASVDEYVAIEDLGLPAEIRSVMPR